MSTEIVRLEAEIAQLRQALTQLRGMPEAQRELHIQLDGRIHALARLYGYLEQESTWPAMSLTVADTSLLISDGAGLRSYPSPFGQARLADLLTSIRSTLFYIAADLGNGHYTRQRQGTAELCQQAVEMMARAGYNLWQLLFASPELATWARALRERSRQQPLQLNLITPGLVIPWHLIYDRDPNNGVELDGFWGLRHELMVAPQPMPALQLPAQPGQPQIQALAGYYLPFATESGDPQLVERQQALMRRLFPATQIVSSDADFLGALRGHPLARLIYLFCHVSQQAPVFSTARTSSESTVGTLGSSLILSTEGGITLHDLWLAAPHEYGPALHGAPLVVLNACNSAAQSPLSDIGLVSFFFAQGAQTLIGSECKVPVIFGDLFGELLLEALSIPGQSIGRVLRGIRRRLIEQYQNPLGMLYTVLGRADMCLLPERRIV